MRAEVNEVVPRGLRRHHSYESQILTAGQINNSALVASVVAVNVTLIHIVIELLRFSSPC